MYSIVSWQTVFLIDARDALQKGAMNWAPTLLHRFRGDEVIVLTEM